MAATKEQIVKAYHKKETTEQALKNARAEGMKAKADANEALETSIESPDAEVRAIVDALAEKKRVQAEAAEEVREKNTAATEAKSKLEELIKNADQWDLFPRGDDE